MSVLDFLDIRVNYNSFIRFANQVICKFKRGLITETQLLHHTWSYSISHLMVDVE